MATVSRFFTQEKQETVVFKARIGPLRLIFFAPHFRVWWARSSVPWPPDDEDHGAEETKEASPFEIEW